MEKEIQNDNDIYNQNDEMIFNPYNSLNKEISKRDIETILKKYGINTSTLILNCINALLYINHM